MYSRMARRSVLRVFHIVIHVVYSWTASETIFSLSQGFFSGMMQARQLVDAFGEVE